MSPLQTTALFVPSGACSGCPFAARCHTARKIVHDRLGESRRTACPFHQDWSAAERHVVVPPPRWKRWGASALRWLVAGG